MLGTAVLVGSLLAVNILLIASYPYPAQMFAQLKLVVPVTVGVFLVGLVTSYLLSRLGRTGDARSLTARFRSRRVLTVFGATAAFAAVVPKALGSVWATEAVYYLSLIVCGIALALWSRASTHVPVLVATLTLITVSAVATILFLSDPGVEFELGPERFLFAIWRHAGAVNMLPLDGIVAWFAWRLADQISRLGPYTAPPAAG